ncbi:MAG: YbbR-like domain-containing protein [Dehalococcoidia bacterium]
MLDALRQLLSLSWAALDATARSLRANWGLAFLSLFLAFGLWLFVTESQNPSRTGVFPVAIPVEPVSLPPGLALVGRIEPVKIRIAAPEDVWDRLSVEDFQALADLSQASVDEQVVPVHVRVVGDDDVRVEGVTPEQVLVPLGKRVSRPVPVVVNVVSAPALGYTAGDPETNPQQVTVDGAEELVNLVEEAVADVNVFGATAKVQEFLKLVARDSRGLVVEGVTLDPGIAQVEVPVEKEVFTSSYVVTPSLRGAPASGYNVTNINIDPTNVTLKGPQEALESITVVPTIEVDISDATSDVIGRALLQLPPEVEAVGVNSVLVWVNIEAAKGEAAFGVAPGWQGLDPSLTVVPAVALVEVRLAGPLPLLSEVTPSQVVVTVDLSGLAEGTHQLEPQVKVPLGLEMMAVVPATIEVELVASP